MNKAIKIILLSLLALFIMLPILSYTVIEIANNCIADGIEQDLKDIELPENTEFVDSVSNAGKITGNGNGMQYYGAIVVASDLTEEELLAYYSQYKDGLYVSKQETNQFFPQDRYHRVSPTEIENFDSAKNNYIIECWNHEPLPEWVELILDSDLRGH